MTDLSPGRRASLEQGFSEAVDGMIRRAAAHDRKDLLEANVDLANELVATFTTQQLSVALAALALRLHRSDAGSQPPAVDR